MRLLIMYSNAPPGAEHLARLRALAPGIDPIAVASEREALEAAGEAEVFLGHRYLRQCLPRAQRLQWLQSTAAGIEHLISPALLERSPLVTRCPIFSDVVAHHAWALAWAVVRRIPEAAVSQLSGEWQAPPELLPLPQTAMVLGLGEIGRAVTRLGRAQGVRILGVTRTDSAEARALCDDLLTSANWRHALPQVDLCFITLPLSRSTRGMVDAAALAALPPHAVVVNVGRGPVLDTAALTSALVAGRLGGAALDVLDPVPPPDHPLWRTPRLLITPKLGVFYPGRQDRLERFIEEQVARYIRGETLRHVVSRDAQIEMLPAETGA